jgi:hypothetical protein
METSKHIKKMKPKTTPTLSTFGGGGGNGGGNDCIPVK